MTKKDGIRVGIFTVLLLLLLSWLLTVFTFPNGYSMHGVRERINTFYELEEDTIDGVYIGSSGVNRYWIPSEAYADKGMTIYNFCTENQPMVLTKYMMEEALKTQKNIKLFVVDIRRIANNPEDVLENDIRRVTDNLPLSKNRIEATKAALEYVEGKNDKIDTTDKSFYFKFLKYHSRWASDLSINELVNPFPKTDYMGYFAHNDWTYRKVPQEVPEFSGERESLNKDNKVVLDDLLDYCDQLKKKDINVLFVSSPYSVEPDREKKLNEATVIIKDRGYNCINFNNPEGNDLISLDYKTDLYNYGHTNIKGAIKFTHYLSDFIDKEYKLPNHKGNEKYYQWDESHEKLIKRTKEKWPEMADELTK